MITFLPYADFKASARVLDRQRLNRQRLEAWQIYDAITNPSSVYRKVIKGPAVRMWVGYALALGEYYDEVLAEWERRGYVNTKLKRIVKARRPGYPMPPWLGDERVHSSHRAQLLRKLPDHYGQFGWTEAPGDAYFWPA